MRKLICYHFITFLILAIFVGCSSIGLSNKVKIIKDDYKPTITVLSIEKSTNPMMLGSGQLIRGFISKNSLTVIHQLYVNHIYSSANWKFFNRAFLIGGKELTLINISRDYNATAKAYYETFGIDLEDEYIRNNPNGFSVKIFAKDGDDLLINVTADQIQSYLEAIDYIIKN